MLTVRGHRGRPPCARTFFVVGEYVDGVVVIGWEKLW